MHKKTIAQPAMPAAVSAAETTPATAETATNAEAAEALAETARRATGAETTATGMQGRKPASQQANQQKNSRKNRRHTGLSKILYSLFMLAGGGAVGAISVMAWPHMELGSGLWTLGLLLLLALLAVYLQALLHEGGHLLFGLLSGYRFCSFRIGSLIWLRQGGKIRLRRYSLAGTGGQCLLAPPDLPPEEAPFRLYHLGGALMNLITAALFAGLALSLPDGPFSFFACLLAGFGLLFGLANGIPLHTALIDNDGQNVLSLRRMPQARRALWLQLKVNEENTAGLRLRDMPSEWFRMPTQAELQNSMCAAIGVFACNRLMDELRFAEAEATMKTLLAESGGLVGIYRNLLTNDLLFCELIGANRPQWRQEYRSREQKKFERAMRRFPSILRTQYAFALLAEHDTAKAADLETAFNKMARQYPYSGDIASERELMAYAANLAEAGINNTAQ